MKKLTGILIAAALILAPMSVSALEMMTDSNMKDVTGQAGVSIAIDDVVLESWSGTTKYIDTDGVATKELVGDGSGGYVSQYTSGTPTAVTISDQHQVQDFQAITSFDDTTLALASPGDIGLAETGLFENADDPTTFFGRLTPLPGDADGYKFEAKALKIDVGTCSVITAGKQANIDAGGISDITYDGDSIVSGDINNVAVAGVVIGLPTLEINTTSEGRNIGIEQTDALNDGKNFIQIENGNSTLHVLGGTVEIAPH